MILKFSKKHYICTPISFIPYNMTTNIYHDFDFRELKSLDFKEDSVREVLILPFLTTLGYERK